MPTAFTTWVTTFTNGARIGTTRTTTSILPSGTPKVRSMANGGPHEEVPGATISKCAATRLARAFPLNSNTQTTVFASPAPAQPEAAKLHFAPKNFSLPRAFLAFFRMFFAHHSTLVL